MKKKCFIIMPISNLNDYSPGHFGRVYEHIIKPACEMSDFEPIRADDIMETNYIALDVIKHIISCDMAICDLSSRNPNVLYELGIRQAFNLPVTLIKDFRTPRIFDIQGFRDLEYDDSLRIDSVEETIVALSEIVKNTYEQKKGVNSLISLLGIEPAKITNKREISNDTELILMNLQSINQRILELEQKFPFQLNTSSVPKEEIEILPESVGEFLQDSEINKINEGERLYHRRYGFGEVTKINRLKNDSVSSVEINFGNYGIRQMVPKFAKFRKVN